MLASFLNKLSRTVGEQPTTYHWLMIGKLSGWVFLGFIVASLLVGGLTYVLSLVGVPFKLIDPTVLNSILAAVVYGLSLALVIGLPWLIKRYRTTRSELGLSRLPEWFDVLLAPAGFIVYLIGSGLLIYTVTQLIPGFNVNQQQDLGFSNVSQRYELILAFLTLVIIAPLAEEMLFRGYLYGKLRKAVPLWVAMLVTSILFGVLHGQWNVGIDVFVLSLVMCTLREMTGSIWAGVLLHMIKNGLAFFLLFVLPILQVTLGM